MEAGSEGRGDNTHMAMASFISCSRTRCQVVEGRAAAEAKTNFTHFMISYSGSLYNVTDKVDSGVKDHNKS
jgi:hypothetical protein